MENGLKEQESQDLFQGGYACLLLDKGFYSLPRYKKLYLRLSRVGQKGPPSFLLEVLPLCQSREDKKMLVPRTRKAIKWWKTPETTEFVSHLIVAHIADLSVPHRVVVDMFGRRI